MAENELASRILAFLGSQPRQVSCLHDIIKNTSPDKKLVNHHLYRMRRQGILQRSPSNPPQWRVCGEQSQSVPQAGFPKRSRASSNKSRFGFKGRGLVGKRVSWKEKNKRSSNFTKFDLFPRVLQLLSHGEIMKTTSIAKSLSMESASQINPALYAMERKNMIRKVSHSPVSWQIVSKSCDSSQQEPCSSSSSQHDSTGYEHDSDMDWSHRHDNLPISSMYTTYSLQQTSHDHNPDGNNGGVTVNPDTPSISEDNRTVIPMGPGSSTCQPPDTEDTSSDISDDIQSGVHKEPTGSSCVDKHSEGISTGIKRKYVQVTGDLDVSEVQMNSINSKTESTAFNAELQSVSFPLVDMARFPKSKEVSEADEGTTLDEDSAIDKVLRTLLVCKLMTAASFVLASKTKLDVEMIESILFECQKLKYVSKSDSVWVLTPNGEQYIKNKLSGDPALQPTLNPVPPLPRQMKNTFTGPPPNPMQLSQMEGGTFSANNSSTDTCTGVHVLSKAESKTQPVPLMSIKPSTMGYKTLLRMSQSGFRPQTVEPRIHIDVASTFPMSVKNTGPGGIDQGCTMSSTFRIPPTPVELVSLQLKKTDIAASHLPQDSSQNISPTTNTSLQLSDKHVTAGIQKLMTATSYMSSRTQQSQLPPNPVVAGYNVNCSTTISETSVPWGSGHRQPDQPQSLLLGGPSMSSIQYGPVSLDLNSESFAALNKNPVSALMEYAQSRHKEARIEVIRQSGPSHKPKFVMGAFLGKEQMSEVVCSNKKDGRKEAADKALRLLISSGQYQPQSEASRPQLLDSQMTHFDRIAAITHKKFNELSASIAESFSGRKVIAGLVLKCSPTDIGSVIAIGSGNRCITGQQLSLEGNTINDSHAEIITRRGFVRFLYKRLLAYDPSKPNELFQLSPSGKLKIKDNITFHLYISTAPCGDGALFSPRDAASNNAELKNLNDRTHHPTFSSNVQGLLRTKIEGGEGTIPIEKDFVSQTFDGIQRGERLRTMSCSDKICRWNIAGMQGALLSHFLDPVYLDSLTLGLLYDHGHLSRAVCCRVSNGNEGISKSLPPSYKVNHPWIGRVTMCDVPRETQKTKALSINWCYGDARAEVVDGTQGLCHNSIEGTLFSRCTKKNMYESFKSLCNKCNKYDLLGVSSYNEAKLLAKECQSSKKIFTDQMKEKGYRTWVSKPVEEEMFN